MIVHEVQCQQCQKRAEAYEGERRDYGGYTIQTWYPPAGWYRLLKYLRSVVSGVAAKEEVDLCSLACVVAYVERPPEPDPVSRYLEETKELPF